eukprot:SAG22_NODE_582_length_8879_cov_2.731663_5_plen_255_part_00
MTTTSETFKLSMTDKYLGKGAQALALRRSTDRVFRQLKHYVDWRNRTTQHGEHLAYTYEPSAQSGGQFMELRVMECGTMLFQHRPGASKEELDRDVLRLTRALHRAQERGMRRHIMYDGWVTKSGNKADKSTGTHKLGAQHSRWLRVDQGSLLFAEKQPAGPEDGPWRKTKTIDEVLDISVVEMVLRTATDGETVLTAEPPKSQPGARDRHPLDAVAHGLDLAGVGGRTTQLGLGSEGGRGGAIGGVTTAQAAV